MKHAWLGLLIVIALAPSATWAHGDVTTSVPAPGELVKRIPKVIRIDFSEPPTADSKFSVKNGCNEEVLADVRQESGETVLVVEDERAIWGRWKVSYNVISSIDGHLTEDRFSFRVADPQGGRSVTSCDGPPGRPQGEQTPEIGEAAPPVTPDEEPAGFPVVPVAIGGAIVVGAIALRFLASR